MYYLPVYLVNLGEFMKNTRLHLALTFICILFLFIASSGALAYRGCAADTCSRRCRDLYHSSEDINEIIKNIKIENSKPQDGCEFDYFMKDFQIEIFCRKHGSGSNRSRLSNMSIDSYFGERFNKTSFNCMCALLPLAVLVYIVRSFKKKKNKS